MKVKKNSSFMTNKELLSNIRSKSKKDMSRNRSMETNISLIEVKNKGEDSNFFNCNK